MFSFFKKKKRGTTLTDEDREAAIEARRLKADERKELHEIRMLELQLQKLEKEAEIQELKEELFGEDEEEDDFSPENMLKMILTRGTGVSPPLDHTTEGKTLSDEQIKEIIARSPSNLVKHAKSMHPDDIAAYIRMQMPNITEDTLNRAIALLKE